MSERRKNCWEYMKCGREPGGKNIATLGICTAATDPSFDGFNQGVNSGRICWLMAGTFCNGVIQGTYAEKNVSCKNCDFYILVHGEEGVTRLQTDAADIFALTQTGPVLQTNEDRYFIKRLEDDSLLVAVADGLGGAVSGDYAAEIMVGALAGFRPIKRGEEQRQLRLLAEETDRVIAGKIERNPDLEGMGTTLLCILVRGGMVYWVHVGDSRLYLHRDQNLTQITKDQILARFLVKEGEITKEQAATHYSRHVMDQYIGCGFCKPETGHYQLKNKDFLILSTDGLHKVINADTIISILNDQHNIENKARSLLKASQNDGGEDNITIVITEVIGIKEWDSESIVSKI